MKKSIILIFSLLMTVASWAVPAKRGLWTNIRLADGTEVRAQLMGDEHLHFYADTNGVRYIANGDGTYSKIVEQDLRKRLAAKIAGCGRVARMPKRIGAVDKSVFQGTQHGLIILVQFTDKQFADGDDQTMFNRIANEENFHEGNFQGSLQDYFHDQSFGQFTLQFDVVGPVNLSHDTKYYGENLESGDDVRAGEMTAEACMAVDDQVDFSKYDWNGDGTVDQVYIIYAGQGEADAVGAENTIWPHSWTLAESDYGKTLQLDGVTINQYACSNEIDGSGALAGIGTICHEFSHCMGFPDMYDILYNGNFGMGDWDLMDAGSYGGDGYRPVGYSAYERMVCGWKNPVELEGDTVVSDIKASINGGDTYIIYNKAHRDEYYMIENRQPTSWDASLPGKGLLVTHIDYDEQLFNDNIVNSTGDFTSQGFPGVKNDHQRLTIVHADDDDDSEYWSNSAKSRWRSTEETDAYPYYGNDSITNYSSPAGMLYNRNIGGHRTLDVAVRDMAVNSDGEGSFTFNDYTHEADTTHSVGTIFYESFDACNGVGGNDGVFSGGSAGTADFFADNDGWIGDAMKGANKCAKSGTNRKSGNMSTPDFNLNGTATLTFLAAPFGNDGTTLTLEGSGGVEITPSEFTLEKGQWTECTATVTAIGESNITFVPAKRMFIDEVLIKTDDATGISQIKNMYIPSDNRIYNLQGIEVRDNGNLPKGIYIKGGRKFIVK